MAASWPLVWDDGKESYFPSDFLVSIHPAQNIGEKDIFGNQYGGDGPKEFTGVTIEGWELQGNYAIRPIFSDGHGSGLYSWEFLKELESRLS